jgi:enoyl-CoA hydratase/carnithine racemase
LKVLEEVKKELNSLLLSQVTGDFISAQTAMDWGLVNRVVPGSEVRWRRRSSRAALVGLIRDHPLTHHIIVDMLMVETGS